MAVFRLANFLVPPRELDKVLDDVPKRKIIEKPPHSPFTHAWYMDRAPDCVNSFKVDSFTTPSIFSPYVSPTFYVICDFD